MLACLFFAYYPAAQPQVFCICAIRKIAGVVGEQSSRFGFCASLGYLLCPQLIPDLDKTSRQMLKKCGFLY
ncbi:hypothetical protein BX661DRAFT_176011 [Kickxella alabastrina]|uniref:uncharacterized protein n=1 Tax=Kickxella alabastrina TaxID=61397 RepID=UPI00221EB604|nr:uncharacterized protein BX661DRAFT_176011 [Kickxella alabastrina]KAI7835055.1 hypothetical protein BX661DRAFT_176011 [Kickxella alabastrina]